MGSRFWAIPVWRCPKIVVPQIIPYNGIFPYKPSIFGGTSMTMENPIYIPMSLCSSMNCMGGSFHTIDPHVIYGNLPICITTSWKVQHRAMLPEGGRQALQFGRRRRRRKQQETTWKTGEPHDPCCLLMDGSHGKSTVSSLFPKSIRFFLQMFEWSRSGIGIFPEFNWILSIFLHRIIHSSYLYLFPHWLTETQKATNGPAKAVRRFLQLP